MREIKSKSDILDFGKHRGKTILWILKNQPSYILWMHENNVASIPVVILHDAEENDMDFTYPDPYDMYNMDD